MLVAPSRVTEYLCGLLKTRRRTSIDSLHTRICLRFASSGRRKIPSPQLVGKKIPIPGFIKIYELAKKLGMDKDQVVKFARQEGYSFKQPSEIILDYNHVAKFVSSFNIIPEYEEVDVIRSDYWSYMQSRAEYPIRPSVISVMGAIDHGKTTLLDQFNHSNIAMNEPGNITQSISAFIIDLETKSLDSTSFGKDLSSESTSKTRVTLLDTPGHSAFFAMRKSGASISDFIILVISAVEGVKKQTINICKMAQQHFVPIVVAINKIDISTQEQIEAVYEQLNQLKFTKIKRSQNSAMKENYDHLFDDVQDRYPVIAIVEISALEAKNLDILKRVIKELHECMCDNLHVDQNAYPAEATVIESFNAPGMGRLLLMINHLGTLERGSHFVVDKYIGIIKTLHVADARYLNLNKDRPTNLPNKPYVPIRLSVDKAGPGVPVLVSGISADSVIPSGSTFFQLKQHHAEKVSNYRQLILEYYSKQAHRILFEKKRPPKGETPKTKETTKNLGELNSELLDVPEEEKKNLSVIIKSDNQGRMNALIDEAERIFEKQGWRLKILSKGLGNVTTRDMFMAQIEIEENKVFRVPVYMFNVQLDVNAKNWMTKHESQSAHIKVGEYNVFTDILEDLKHEILLKKQRMQKEVPLPPAQEAKVRPSGLVGENKRHVSCTKKIKKRK